MKYSPLVLTLLFVSQLSFTQITCDLQNRAQRILSGVEDVDVADVDVLIDEFEAALQREVSSRDRRYAVI